MEYDAIKLMPPGLCPVAQCALRGGDGYPKLRGLARFYPWAGGTLLEVHVRGLPRDGFFALHIHSVGDCDTGGDVAFHGAGGHYDPVGQALHPNHAGDLPNLLSCEGQAWMTCYTGRFAPGDVLGRAAVIHLQPDDYRSQPAGDAGARIACGVIQRTTCRRGGFA